MAIQVPSQGAQGCKALLSLRFLKSVCNSLAFQHSVLENLVTQLVLLVTPCSHITVQRCSFEKLKFSLLQIKLVLRVCWGGTCLGLASWLRLHCFLPCQVVWPFCLPSHPSVSDPSRSIILVSWSYCRMAHMPLQEMASN